MVDDTLYNHLSRGAGGCDAAGQLKQLAKSHARLKLKDTWDVDVAADGDQPLNNAKVDHVTATNRNVIFVVTRGKKIV